MSTSTDFDAGAFAAVLDADRTQITGDVLCLGCDYNLRTLDVSAGCPECGRPVTDTLRYDNLRFSDPRWLRRVRTGTTAMFAASIGMLGSLALVAGGVSIGATWLATVSLYTILATLACWCWGIFQGTSKEPILGATVDGMLIRWLTRFLALASLLIWFIVILMVSFSMFGGPAIRIPLAICAYLLPFFSPMTVCLYFRPLGRRGHRTGLSRLNTILAALLGLDGVVMLTFLVLPLAFGVNLDPSLVLGPLLLVYTLCCVLGFFGFVGHRRMLTRALAGRALTPDSEP